MKLTKNSELLMSFFSENHINHVRQTNKTNDILKTLYHEILKSYNYLLMLKQTKGQNLYNISIKKITNVSQITKPINFNASSFPEEIRNHINDLSLSEICFTFSLFNRKIKLHFIVEEPDVENKIAIYTRYVDSIVMWLYILNEYSDGGKKCALTFTVYFYFTSLDKKLPKTNIDIFDRIHINTAFTTTCPQDSEIVIFRKEEWFKVFIHETFHNFALDFSDMNTDECNKNILSIFNVDSEVNLYESYTEFWAEIMNALFCSFFVLKDKKNIDEFISNSEFFINFEKTYSFFQLVKALDFMGLTYKNMYSKTNNDDVLKNTLYKEKTSVLSYYIIKTILINNYQQFLLWCTKHNLSLLQFKKTTSNLSEFCNFIKKNYKNKAMIDNVKIAEKYYNNVHQLKKGKHVNYLLTNMRMSICELG
jgi:hypothetical protein